MHHDPLFDSAWFKWLGAVVHAQTLQDDIEARRRAGNANPVRAFRTEYNLKRHGFGVIVKELAPMSLRWCLLVGDIASNYRASLDHLSWALVCRGRTPPGGGKLTTWQENGIYFPIAQYRSEFNADVDVTAKRPKLPGVRRADIAKVRRRQPYHYSARNRPRHPLSLLTSINNRDKHRTIQPLWTFPNRTDVEITNARDCLPQADFLRRRSSDPLHVGAEIAFFRAKKIGPNPELEMKLKVAAEPTLDERISVREWHKYCAILIFKLLRDFSAQPAGMDEIEPQFARLGS